MPTVVLPVPPFGTIEVEPETLTFTADPGRPDPTRASGRVFVRVATNAANGFILRLVADGLRSPPRRTSLTHAPRLSIDDSRGNAQVFDMSALGSSGVVVADSPGPVPTGQLLQFRMTLATEVDFLTAPDSYAAHLRFQFEPRY